MREPAVPTASKRRTDPRRSRSAPAFSTTFPARALSLLAPAIFLIFCGNSPAPSASSPRDREAPAAGRSSAEPETAPVPRAVIDRVAGGYRLRLGPDALVEFDVPALAGTDPADVELAPAAAPFSSWTRVRMRWRVPAPVKQDELSVRFHWLQKPDFWWAPHLAPEPGNVIAQHAFRSPALIVQSGPLTVTIIPDLDLVGRDPGNPWFMDMDAPAAQGRLGLSLTEVSDHVLFRQVPGMTFAPGDVEIAFFVAARRDSGPVRDPWADASRFLWERWARPLFLTGAEPVAAPLENYVRHTYRWAFDSWGKFVWQEFAIGGRAVGAPQFIVNVSQSPNSPAPWYQREFLSIWNQAWFSSLRSASGVFRYARRTSDDALRRKALLTKELALAAPVTDGLFPSVIRTDNVEVADGSIKVRRPRGWETAYWTNSDRSPVDHGISSDWFHVLDMSWTALHMVRWFRELEPDRRLLDYAAAYGDRLLKLQDAGGFFPGWLHPATHLPGPVMNRTPETSLSVTFLLELAAATGRETYSAAALKAMDAVVKDIIPEGRWEDFETYWSCSPWGRDRCLGKKVERNAMHKQNTLSMFWTAEALLACYEATGERRYLDWGRRTLDELSMAQQVWQPPFIYVPALGGFGVMNADGEWNDSRETLFAELFLDYARETGNETYRERGLAALKAGFVMMYCPENPQVKAMWEKVYPWFGPADYGFTMENYGHGGRTSPEGEGMGVFTIYDWGNGAAAEAAMRIMDHHPELFKR